MELIITAKVKLLTDKEQTQELADTLKAAGSALNHASKIAYGNNLLSSFKGLQRLVYTDLRSQYGLQYLLSCSRNIRLHEKQWQEYPGGVQAPEAAILLRQRLHFCQRQDRS